MARIVALMACDPTQLLEDAKCIMWCVPRTWNAAIKVSLLCQIAGGGLLETFYILAETGAILNAENADKLRKE